MIVVDFTPEQIRKLAEKHIRRFNYLITSGSPDVRMEECRGYVRVWSQVLLANGMWDQIENAGKNEILDAIDAGDME